MHYNMNLEDSASFSIPSGHIRFPVNFKDGEDLIEILDRALTCLGTW